MIYVPVAILAQLVVVRLPFADFAAMAAVMLVGAESKAARQRYGLRDDQYVFCCWDRLYVELPRGGVEIDVPTNLIAASCLLQYAGDPVADIFFDVLIQLGDFRMTPALGHDLGAEADFGIGAAFPSLLDLGVIASWMYIDRAHWSSRWRWIGRHGRYCHAYGWHVWGWWWWR